MRLGWVLAAALAFAGAAAAVALLAVRFAGADGTEIASSNEMTFPDDYRSWVFVGASTGLSYSERGPASGSAEESDPGLFHHTYLNREAFEQFSRTGTFPEKTMLVLEVRRPERKVSIQRRGWFEGELVGREMAVKDRSRFEEGWAYFSFDEGATTARPFPRDSCFSCHHEHGDDDNVFTQFYPVLREAKAALQEPAALSGGKAGDAGGPAPSN